MEEGRNYTPFIIIILVIALIGAIVWLYFESTKIVVGVVSESEGGERVILVTPQPTPTSEPVATESAETEEPTPTKKPTVAPTKAAATTTPKPQATATPKPTESQTTPTVTATPTAGVATSTPTVTPTP